MELRACIAGEMSRLLRMLAALAENLASDPALAISQLSMDHLQL